MMKMIFTMKKVRNLDDMNAVFERMASIPEVRDYIKSHKLINKQIFKNDCYEIQMRKKITVVYVDSSIMCV